MRNRVDVAHTHSVNAMILRAAAAHAEEHGESTVRVEYLRSRITEERAKVAESLRWALEGEGSP